MPVRACRSDGKPGYRWGDSGKCYTYTSGNDRSRREAKRKAVIQGIAAGERPSAAVFNDDIALAGRQVERLYLKVLQRAYEDALASAYRSAADKFALTAAADWQLPPEGATLTVAEITAIAASLNEALSPTWAKIAREVGNIALARVELDWEVKHPVPARLVEQAALRTPAKIGEAAQFTIRELLAAAYDEGRDVRETAARIRSAAEIVPPWQADMLARTDLNMLANGASEAASREVGMQFKTWFATLDDKTRPEHVEAHGQTVPITEAFTVGGEDALYPGDPNLSDAMACNCRCSIGYADTLDEANGLTADGGGRIMDPMTRRQRKRKAASRKPDTATGTTVNSMQPFAKAVTAAARPIAFAGVAAIEGRISDDNSIAPRVLLPDSLNWPEMPVSFMAQTKTAEGHDGAEVAGRVDEFQRKRGTGKQRDILFRGEFTTDHGMLEIAPMIADETMRYVSADLGATEWTLVTRKDLSEVPEEEFEIERAAAGEYAMGLRSGKVKALTLVPTQAIEGATIALTASADGTEATVTFPIEWIGDYDWVADAQEALVAAAAPVNPPREWFETPEPPGKMPLTVTKEGRVYGHLATWDSCHMGFLPSCVPPPKSASNYAYAHVCELDTADGAPITVGKLMFSPTDGGHADRRLSAQRASEYYDRTGMAAAYLRFSDGAHGIWAAGSLNPRLTDEEREEMRRELRLHPPSGDWRPINGQHELICGLAVAVPGFATPRAVVTVVASGDKLEVEDAIIASSGHFDPDPAAVAALERNGLIDEDIEAERELRVLAARAEGMDALAALVKD